MKITAAVYMPTLMAGSFGGSMVIANDRTTQSAFLCPFHDKSSWRYGFTLLEIIVVVFILSLLVAIVAPKIMGRTDDAKIADAKVQIKNFETALKLFKIDNGFYPTTEQGLESLIEKPATGQVPAKYREGGYLEQKKIPLDPWGNPYIYVSPGIHGDFDILSYGGDGKEGGEGKDADIKSWDMQ